MVEETAFNDLVERVNRLDNDRQGNVDSFANVEVLTTRLGELIADLKNNDVKSLYARINALESNVPTQPREAREGRKMGNLTSYKGLGDIGSFGGNHEEYGDWTHRVKTFLGTEAQ